MVKLTDRSVASALPHKLCGRVGFIIIFLNVLQQFYSETVLSPKSYCKLRMTKSSSYVIIHSIFCLLLSSYFPLSVLPTFLHILALQ